jgi:tRNA A-37 threonylcarbamoyl transferase component Bud32
VGDAGLIEHVCGGVRWVLAPEAASLPGQGVLEHIEELETLPGATRLKRTTVRSVYRVEGGHGPPLIVKVFRAPSWRRRFKERYLRSQAGREWAALRRLGAMGVAVSRAVALGRPADRRGEVQAYLIVEAAPDAAGANVHLKALEREPKRLGAFARRLGEFVRRLHDAGVRHDDLHSGNILVQPDAATGEERLLVIDLQRVRVGRRPGARHRAWEVARLLRTLRGGRASAAGIRAAFLEAYCGAEPRLREERLSPEAVERLMERQRARRLRSRARRCLRDSSGFAVETAGERRVYRSRAWPLAEVLRVVEGGGAGDSGLTVREFAAARGVGRVLGAFRRSAAVREYAALHRQRLATRSGPRPVAAVEYRGGRERGRSVLVAEAESG